eukprot:7209312-Prymnesium_polylepis.1
MAFWYMPRARNQSIDMKWHCGCVARVAGEYKERVGWFLPRWVAGGGWFTRRRCEKCAGGIPCGGTPA